jgi:hypothetical protein
VAASVLVAVFVGRGVDRRDPAFVPSLASEPWTAPTDFLLKTPGFEVLATTPRIGAPPRLALLEDAARSGVPPH